MGRWTHRAVGLAVILALLIVVAGRAKAGAVFETVNLVSDQPGHAAHTDPNLVNPWGIAHSSGSPFWVSDNGAGVSTLYNGSGIPQPQPTPLVVTIPPPTGGTPPSAPTGVVFNGTSDFASSHFIFATEGGTIARWNSGTDAITVGNPPSGAVYKGLAIGSDGSANFLYATNFHAGTINVFDKNFSNVTNTTFAGKFTDPALPAGFAPFGIQNIGGNLYVTYAKQDADKHDDVAGPGNGFIDVFSTAGTLMRRFASNGTLNSPWGLTIAPPGFGPFGGDLLVGNFGDGEINAFKLSNGAFDGQLLTASGTPLLIDGLWGLSTGNDGNAGRSDQLFFTAGPDDEAHGLFGQVSLVPEPSSLALGSTAALIGLGYWWRRGKRATA